MNTQGQEAGQSQNQDSDLVLTPKTNGHSLRPVVFKLGSMEPSGVPHWNLAGRRSPIPPTAATQRLRFHLLFLLASSVRLSLSEKGVPQPAQNLDTTSPSPLLYPKKRVHPEAVPTLPSGLSRLMLLTKGTVVTWETMLLCVSGSLSAACHPSSSVIQQALPFQPDDLTHHLPKCGVRTPVSTRECVISWRSISSSVIRKLLYLPLRMAVRFTLGTKEKGSAQCLAWGKEKKSLHWLTGFCVVPVPAQG